MAGIDLLFYRAPRNPRARKRFGQHFLIDEQIVEETVACIGARPGQTIIEIGPGRGALTSRLLDAGAVVHAIEIDRDLVAELTARFGQRSTLIVHEADALKFNFDQLRSRTCASRIVGNLPYNISTPLLLRLLRSEGSVEEMCFMVQKEVGERLVATPGSSDYGRLSVMTQAFAAVTIAFEVPPSAFSPAPRVDSCVVSLRPRVAKCPFAQLESIVKNAFAQRRKMLRHSLGRTASSELLARLGISMTDRAENVSVDQYVALAASPDAPDTL